MRRAFAAARLIASIIEFSEIGAETIYIISAPDRASFIVCLGLFEIVRRR